jgi:GH15 family glucan-1,4-alpha-glucosidase
MAEGTRVSQLAESLAKFHEEYKYFKASTTAFQTSITTFQTSTHTTLEEILKKLGAMVTQPTQPNKELVPGETSGQNNKDPILVELVGETKNHTVQEGGGI